jgi:Type II CAAX prenyl endopeptidase Rce1-like
MAKSRAPRRPRNPASIDAYWDSARRPLQILAFLLPLIIFYELALTSVLQSPQSVRTVLAHKYLLRFFDAFHIAPEGGLHLGGIAIVVVLLVWHILTRDAWRIDLRVVGYMAVETIIITLPLLVLSQVIRRPLAAEAFLAFSRAPGVRELSFLSRSAIGIGAGLYEELIFRMLLIAVIHTLLVDVGKASSNVGAAVAVAVSAAAFTIYHPLESVAQSVFLFLAGLYFGAVYVVRGFGIVVGVHALYDIITFLLMSPA